MRLKKLLAATNLIIIVAIIFPEVQGRIASKRVIEELGIKVECSRNCNPSYVESPILLEVICTAFMGRCPKGVKFSWSVRPHPKYFQFERDASPSADGRELKLAPWAFLPNTEIAFMALAEGQSGEVHIKFAKKRDLNINIHCVKNCPISEPNKDVVYEVDCNSCVPKTVTWQISPLPDDFPWAKNIKLSHQNEVIRILANAFEDNYQTNLIVAAQNDAGHRLTSVHKMKFVFYSAVLHIECLSNCGENVIATEEMKLTAICNARCVNESYVWTLSPATTLIETSETNDELITILPNAYLGGINVKVVLKQGEFDPIEYSFLTIGNCSIEPDVGYSGVTKFHVTCSYPDDVKISVTQIADFTEADEGGIVLYDGTKIDQVPLLLSEGNPTYITVVVKKFEHSFYLQAIVEPMPASEKAKNMEITLKEKILSLDNDTTLPSLIVGKNYSEAVQMSSALLTSLNELDNEPFKEHYRRHIFEQINEVAQEIDPLQLVSLMVKAVEEGRVLDSPTGHLVAEAVHTALWNVQNQCCNYTDKEAEQIANDALLVLEHLAKKSGVVEDQLLGPVGNDAGVDYPLYDEVDPTRAKALYNQELQSHFIVDSLQAMGNFLDEKGNPRQFQKNDMATSSQWLTMQPEIVNASNVKSYLNISEALATELSNSYHMIAQVASLNPNPFWWHPVSKDIHSELVMANLFLEESKVTQLDNYLDLYIDTYEDEGMMPIRAVFSDDIMLVYKFDGEMGAKLEVAFNHIDNVDYYVLITMTYPTVFEVKEDGYRVSAGRRNRKTLIMTDDYVYIGIARYLGLLPTYEILLKMTKCISWTDDEREWTTKHCRIGGLSTAKYTHCQCNHLSLFAVSVTVPPYKLIKIPEISLTGMIIKSVVVYMSLIVVTIIWGILMIWAHYRDNEINRIERTFNVPVDTMPGDENVYIVSVETGFWLGSGCTSRVALQLIGDNGKSRAHLIHGPDLLKRGAEDWYVIYTIKDLGNMRFIHLFHDSTGMSPHWYCERVIILHPATGRKFIFVVQKWLSLFWSDGKVERHISVSPMEDLKSGNVLFPHHAKLQLKNEHLWLSMFSRQPGCSFTNKERVAVSFTTILLSMVVSGAFYGLGDPNTLDTANVLTVTELVVAIKSLLIVFPIGFIILIFFQKSRSFALRIEIRR